MTEDKVVKRPESVVTTTTIPFLYTNGVLVGLTLTDVSLTITINGQPTHQLNMSHVTAKALITNLQQALGDFEKRTGTKISDIKDIQQKMATFKKEE